MTTEKDIRNFIQDNKIRVPQDDKFMEDLIRQINLLPKPSGFSDTEISRKDMAETFRLISQTLKKRNKAIAFESVVMNIIVCSMILCCALLVGETDTDNWILGILIDWRYLICSIFCMVFVLSYNLTNSIYNDFINE